MINKINLEPKNELEVKESIYEILNLLSQEQLTNLNWLLSKEIEKMNLNNNNNINNCSSLIKKTEFPIPKNSFYEKNNQGIFYKNYQPLQSKIYPSASYSKKNIPLKKTDLNNNNNKQRFIIKTDYSNSNSNFNFEDECFKEDFIKEYTNAEPFLNDNVPFLKKKRDCFNINNNNIFNNFNFQIKKRRGRPKKNFKNDDKSTDNSSSIKFKKMENLNNNNININNNNKSKKIIFETITYDKNYSDIKKEKFNSFSNS